ncbi:DUF3861 family protein [Chitinophaga sp. S165]|uniref:DUF3861 family protein n=1 Tax=Chitinophaga sp. S165 TaxID=2135462 RepID=UPI000D70D9E2|nr:DUF3861 family protein [Chitinophaga sp. S165]PWV53323.1 uncharacterized protein DUF3861 [Chitinophaga sp. S165]
MNEYHLTLTRVREANGQAGESESIHLDIKLHDEIYEIIDRVNGKNIFSEQATASEFAIGLKLFGEIIIKYRHTPLFNDFLPHFKSFMKKLKQYNGEN